MRGYLFIVYYFRRSVRSNLITIIFFFLFLPPTLCGKREATNCLEKLFLIFSSFIVRFHNLAKKGGGEGLLYSPSYL